MKKILHALADKIALSLWRRIDKRNSKHAFIRERLCSVYQRQLALSYREDWEKKLDVKKFQEVGFGLYSQHDEDGILLYLFSLLGHGNRYAVEICCGDGYECNTSNLILHHGWSGILIDGQKTNMEKARDFFHRHPDTKYWPPVLLHEWVTAENINQLLEINGCPQMVDLLSLDLDGNDYWIWKALTWLEARVVVLEFNHLLGPERKASIPYDPKFQATYSEEGTDYAGASISAFVALGRKKGYRLVGGNRYGTNAFFLRESVGEDIFSEVPADSLFSHPRAQYGINIRAKRVQGLDWVDV